MKILSFLIILPCFLFANNQDLVKNKKKYHFETFESLRVDITAGQSSLLTTTNSNTSFTAKSTKMISTELKYLYHWSTKNRSFIGLGFTDLTYKSNLNFYENDLSQIKIGHTYNPHYRISLSGELFYLSYFGLDSNFNFSTLSSPGVKGDIKIDLYHKYETRVGFFGGISLLKEAAYIYEVGAFYRKIYRTFSIEINLHNQQGLLQNTQYLRTSINNNLIGSKISIPFR